MNPFTLSQIQKDLSTPGSPYYLNAPSAGEFINNYMNGTAGANQYFGNPQKTTYLGQPKQDKFELTAHTNKRRKQEALFITAVTALASLFALRSARRIPLVNKIPDVIIKPAIKGIGVAIRSVGKAIWWLVGK